MKTFFMLLVLLLTQVALAQSEPKPLPADKVMRLSTLKKIFDAGVSTNEKNLTGQWKSVAIATNVECGKIGNLLDAYDLSGIKNQDGSVKVLIFKAEQVSVPDLSGGHVESYFTVRLQDLGSSESDQGPYVVDPLEPQFAQYSYHNQGQIYDEASYTYSCRFVRDNSHQLICGIELKILGNIQDSTGCAKSGIGIIEAFVKM